jgi:hypothetical protein
VIGEPSPWLVASGRFAEKLPPMFNMRLTFVALEEFMERALKNRSVAEACNYLYDKY